MLLIVLVATVLRFTGYNFGLPYIDTPDEPTFFTGSLNMRGLYYQAFNLPGYPPGILWSYEAAQVLVERLISRSAVEQPADTVAVMRVAAILTSLLAIVVIGLAARRLGGTWAGLITAGAWAVLPDIILPTSIGMPDAWLILFTALAIYWALIGFESGWVWWSLLSTLAGLAAILFKYSIYPVLGLGIALSLWKLWKFWGSEINRWRALSVFAFQLAAIVLCAFWLFMVYKAGSLVTLGGPATAVYQSGLSRIVDIPLGIRLIATAIAQLGLNPWLATGFLLVGGVGYLRNHRPAERLGWLLLLGFAFSAAWLTGTYLTAELGFVKYYLLPASLGFLILIVVALLQVGAWLTRFARYRYAGFVAMASFIIIWLGPMTNMAWISAQEHCLPDTRAALATWSASALGEGSILVDKYNARTFNREWGGYAGPYRVWLPSDTITQHPLSDWVSKHVNYAEFSPQQLIDLESSESGKSYLDQMLKLRQFPPPGQRFQWRGPEMIVYRLWRAQHPLNVEFGGQIRLAGYDLSPEQPQRDQSLHLTLYWQAVRAPSDNYNVYIHLAPLDSRVPIAQADGAPASIDRPTLTWTDPTETLISRDFQIRLPADLKSGQYRLIVGLYNYQTGQRLLAGNEDYVLLTLLPV